MTRNFVLAITGGSGAAYAVRLLDVLLAGGYDVHVSISPAGQAVLQQELALEVDLDRFLPSDLLPEEAAAANSDRYRPLRWMLGMEGRFVRLQPAAGAALGQLHYHHYRDLMSRIASGSSPSAGMVICPCSGGTMSAVAHGASTNLIQRAADVHLKERRKLVLVPRETPLSLIHLENMRRCTEAGAVVLPAMPGFYHCVRSIRDLIDFVVGRICDQLAVPHDLVRRWGE